MEKICLELGNGKVIFIQFSLWIFCLWQFFDDGLNFQIIFTSSFKIPQVIFSIDFGMLLSESEKIIWMGTDHRFAGLYNFFLELSGFLIIIQWNGQLSTA